jgi:eukaryotic-like serine/threonine-protein kinase
MPGIAGQQGGEIYSFGPFRVDAPKQVLLRDGQPVPLTPKAFQILLVLLRRNNQLVSKDEIMKAVWPDTFVEETNLTRNIFNLRKALGESAEKQYIITVSGRGYRFVEKTSSLAEPDSRPSSPLEIVAASHSSLQIEVEEQRSRHWVWIAAGVVCLAAVAFATLRLLPRQHTFTDKDSVVIADFVNETGDSVFDGALSQGLVVQIEQSPFLHVISPQRVQHTLALMGHISDARFTAEIAREVCQRVGATAVLEGSISRLGSEYVLGLKAVNCATGDAIAEQQKQAATKEQVLNTLGEMTTTFRSQVGESLATVKLHNRPLDEVTTGSLDALKAYSLGMHVLYTEGQVAAEPYFQRAIELDPRFAVAYTNLALVYTDSGESELSAQSMRKAYALRDRVSDRERFFISAIYERSVTGNMQRARQICEMWARTYPRDVVPHGLMSGGVSQTVGDFERSLSEAQQAIQLDPEFMPAYVNQAFTYFVLGRLDDVNRAIQSAQARGLEPPELILLRYYVAVTRGDEAERANAVARAKGRAGAEDWLSHGQALIAASQGRLQLARKLSQQAIDLASANGKQEVAAGYEAASAIYEAQLGDARLASRRASSALQRSHGRDTEYSAATALALIGDFKRARTLAEDLGTRFPEDTVVRTVYLPTLRATIALQQVQSNSATESFATSAAPNYVLCGDGFAVLGGLGAEYTKGLTYLAAGRNSEAVKQFAFVVDHPATAFEAPVRPLALLQLAKAYALLGDDKKARETYERLLAEWHNADSDLPILRQVKAEFARLQQVVSD